MNILKTALRIASAVCAASAVYVVENGGTDLTAPILTGLAVIFGLNAITLRDD